MAIKVGINGFGRIGRQIMRIMKTDFADTFDVVAFNDLGDLKTMAHLFKYDSNFGKFNGTVEVLEDGLVINGDKVLALSQRDPAQLPWGDLGVDVVIESTGVFRDRAGASKHLEAGAKKVIISAPAKDPDWTVVLGVNDDEYDAAKHNIISNASCTTNCLAPAAKVVNDKFGIKTGIMTTIHAYTADQRILDLPHKDLRRGRAAAMSIIPTTTGAAKAVALVIPDLEGKFDGYALRVPTSTVSIVDFVADVEKEVTTESLRAALKEAAEGDLKGIMGYAVEPLVSVDYKGCPNSSTIDEQFTMALGGNMVKVVTWYDNEWGYSARTVDLAKMVGEAL